MRTSYKPSPDSRDATIRHLQDELYIARTAIVSLMDEPQRQLLSGYYACDSRSEGYRWESDVADKLIESAVVLPRVNTEYVGPRAFCPLCGDGTSSPYESGFRVPEGLRRHLVGWGARHNQCRVFGVVSRLAHDYWNDKFKDAELRKSAQREAHKHERAAIESRFVVDPLSEPLLADDSLGYGAIARVESEMAWAESRLESIGFQKIENQN